MLVGSTPVGSTPAASHTYTSLVGAGHQGIGLDISTLRDVNNSLFYVELNAKQNSFNPPDITSQQGITQITVASMSNEPFIGFNAPETVFRFSNQLYYPGPNDSLRANLVPFAALQSPGDIERYVSIAIEDFNRGQTSFGETHIINSDGRFDSIFDNYNPDGGTIKIFYGPKWADFSLFFQVGAGIVSNQWYKSRNIITIPVTAQPNGLSEPFSLGTFDGSGDLGGDPDLKGRQKNFAFGRNIFNITPILVNKAYQVYQVSNTAVSNIDSVKDKGVPLNGSIGNVETYQDLINLNIPHAYYATCNRLGLFRAAWSTVEPDGLVTCDLDGLVHENTLLGNTGEFIKYVLTVVTGFSDTRLDYGSLVELPAGEIAYYYDGSTSKTVEDILNEILRPINGFSILDRKNRFSFNIHRSTEDIEPKIELEHGVGTENDIISMTQEETDIKPVYNVQFNYARNFTPMTIDQISTSLSDSDIIRLRNEYLSTSVSDTDLQFRDPSSISISINTFFNNKADAEANANSQLRLRTTRKSKHNIVTKLIGLSVNPGDVIKITHPRFAPSGKKYTVYRTSDKLGQYKIEIGAFG